MSKHKTSPIPHTHREWTIARRKGNRYRMFDATTGKMSKWLRITPPSSDFLAAYARQASALTVPQLRHRAERWGLNIPSKMRKAELLDILAVRSYYRSYRLGS